MKKYIENKNFLKQNRRCGKPHKISLNFEQRNKTKNIDNKISVDRIKELRK